MKIAMMNGLPTFAMTPGGETAGKLNGFASLSIPGDLHKLLRPHAWRPIHAETPPMHQRERLLHPENPLHHRERLLQPANPLHQRERRLRPEKPLHHRERLLLLHTAKALHQRERLRQQRSR